MDKFRECLENQLCRPQQQDDCYMTLKSIRQQNGSVDKLNTRFRLLISKAGLDMVQNATLLVQMYEDAISPRLFQTLVVNGKNLTTSKCIWQMLQKLIELSDEPV